MADTTKTTEVPETTPAAIAPVESTPAAETSTAAAETSAAEEIKTTEAPVEGATEAPAESAAAPAEVEEEVKPVEEGTLEHKGAPANFPKNLIYSKQHFWFGNDAIPADKLSAFTKGEKVTETAHHVASWASHTGKGLLFYGKEADKGAPHGAIQLAEASEPTTEGNNKFFIHVKGHKHAFKAPSAADRDNWVSQLKLKIAEAKELATTVTESETYKKTLGSLKPTPPTKKEEKAVESAETPAVAATEATEIPKEENPVVAEPAKEEVKEEKKEEPKRRSASRKRGSIFGNLLGKKEEKKEEAAAPSTTEEIPAVEPVTESEAPATEPITTEAPKEETAAPVATEETPVEAAKETKPAPTKRNSLFGSLSFGKKKPEAEAAAPITTAKDVTTPTAETEPVAETAPVIPAVETSAPLSTEVASPANVPVETTDITPAPATNGEKVKSDKRKSSLPFVFGKKEKATSDEEGANKTSAPFFSMLRQTVKGKGKTAPAEKAEDKPAETSEAAPATTVAAPVVEEEPKPVAPVAATPVSAAA